uniref:MADF domain-containing protein n=1 Tax=Graphocephala atropunctata TaxID=36148 RepID=A0A1B6KEH7_9HEMI
MGFEVAYDPGENIKIVKTVEKYPVLYNTRKYPPIEFRGVADQAWTKVASELGVSEGSCKGRWTNIRGCFKRYLKNKARSKSTKTYYLAEYLNFLLPFMNMGHQVERIIHDDCREEDKRNEMDVGTELEVKLVDSDGEEESFFISTTSNHSEEESMNDGKRNADWDFLSSLLPDVQRMDAEQKSKFKNALLTAVDITLYGEDF